MSRRYPAYEAHRSMRYSLSWLPMAAREALKTAFDQNGPTGDTGLIAFAELFGYGPQETMAIAERSRVAAFQYSPTMGFLAVLERRGITIQNVQDALEEMRVAAADVIPIHIDAIVAFGSIQQARNPLPTVGPAERVGQMNIERSNCDCAQCHESQRFDESSRLAQSNVNNRTTGPSAMNIRNPGPSSMNIRNPASSSMNIRNPASSSMNIRNPASSSMNIRNAGPVSMNINNEPASMNDRSTTPASMNVNLRDTHNINSEVSIQHFINNLNDMSIESSERLSMNSAESGPSDVNGPHPVTNGVVSVNDPQLGTNGYANGQCSCESCRIQSDPHETLLLVPISTPKMPCTMNSMQQNRTRTMDPVSAPSRTVDGADSNGAMANTAHPAPCCTCKKCQRQGMVICNNTSTPHYLGDNPQCCEYCRVFVSTLVARGRCSDKIGNVTETEDGDQRHSWHGDNSRADARIPALNQSLSDSQLHINGFTGDPAASSRPRTAKLASYYSIYNRTQNGVGEVANRDTPGSMAASSGRSNERGGSTIQRSLRLYNVFVTYSWNGMDVNHLHEVLRLCDRLRGAGITVRMDMDSELFMSLGRNKVEWLDMMTAQASHIIACISPSYYEDTQQVNAVSPEMNQLNARYVFDKIRLEYYNNMSMNKRVVPVIFQNSGATVNHVPHCMGSTLVYSYPVNVQLIIDHIQHQ